MTAKKTRCLDSEEIMKTTVKRLSEHVGRVRYGKIIYTFIIHESNVVKVSEEISETTRKEVLSCK